MPLATPSSTTRRSSSRTPVSSVCGNGTSEDPAWNPFGDRADDSYAAFLDYKANNQPLSGWNVFVAAENTTLGELYPAHYPSFLGELFNPYDLNGLAIPTLEFFTEWPLPRRSPCS